LLSNQPLSRSKRNRFNRRSSVSSGQKDYMHIAEIAPLAESVPASLPKS
jgi:hypothetical protein